jgi:hypothetical protein
MKIKDKQEYNVPSNLCDFTYRTKNVPDSLTGEIEDDSILGYSA